MTALFRVSTSATPEPTVPKPKIAIKFDIDQNEAIQTREKLLKEFKERKLKVIGTHASFIEPKFLD